MTSYNGFWPAIKGLSCQSGPKRCRPATPLRPRKRAAAVNSGQADATYATQVSALASSSPPAPATADSKKETAARLLLIKAKLDRRSTRDSAPNTTPGTERRTRRSSPLQNGTGVLCLRRLRRRPQSRPLKGRARAYPSSPPPALDHSMGGTAAMFGGGSACERTLPPGQAARGGRARPGGIKCIRSDFYGSGPPLLPQQKPAADEWLPPLAFLLPGAPPPVPWGWVPWASSLGTPRQPRSSVFAASAGTVPESWGRSRP